MGRCIEHTGHKACDVINKAIGSILFVDEARATETELTKIFKRRVMASGLQFSEEIANAVGDQVGS